MALNVQEVQDLHEAVIDSGSDRPLPIVNFDDAADDVLSAEHELTDYIAQVTDSEESGPMLLRGWDPDIVGAWMGYLYSEGYGAWELEVDWPAVRHHMREIRHDDEEIDDIKEIIDLVMEVIDVDPSEEAKLVDAQIRYRDALDALSQSSEALLSFLADSYNSWEYRDHSSLYRRLGDHTNAETLSDAIYEDPAVRWNEYDTLGEVAEHLRG